MKLGDIVTWIPDYVESISSLSPLWLGVVVENESNQKSGYVKVQWYANQENYYATDWTLIRNLKLISLAE